MTTDDDVTTRETDDSVPLSDCCGEPRDARYETPMCSRCHDHATFHAEDA